MYISIRWTFSRKNWKTSIFNGAQKIEKKNDSIFFGIKEWYQHFDLTEVHSHNERTKLQIITMTKKLIVNRVRPRREGITMTPVVNCVLPQRDDSSVEFWPQREGKISLLSSRCTSEMLSSLYACKGEITFKSGRKKLLCQLSSHVMSCLALSCLVSSRQVWSHLVSSMSCLCLCLCQVRSGQVRSGHVRSV